MQVGIAGWSFQACVDIPVVMRLGKGKGGHLGIAIDIKMLGQYELVFFGLTGVLMTLYMYDH